MSSKYENNIILFSVPRSGSTWLSEVLTYKNGIRKVHEPDNELNSYFGLHHKVGLPRFPFLTADDHNEKYKRLFQIALHHNIADQASWQNKLIKKIYGLKKEKLQSNLAQNGVAMQNPISMSKFWLDMVTGNRSEQKTLIKTVHASLAVPFLVKHLKFKPVILTRHPLNVYSSYVNLNMPDGNRKLYQDLALLEYFGIQPVDSAHEKTSDYLAGYQLGVFEIVAKSYRSLDKIQFVDYEQVISNPFEEVERLCSQLNIQFDTNTKAFMESKFKVGKGYDTNRKIDGHDSVWEKRLSTQEVDEFLKGYEFAFGSINFDL